MERKDQYSRDGSMVLGLLGPLILIVVCILGLFLAIA